MHWLVRLASITPRATIEGPTKVNLDMHGHENLWPDTKCKEAGFFLGLGAAGETREKRGHQAAITLGGKSSILPSSVDLLGSILLSRFSLVFCLSSTARARRGMGRQKGGLRTTLGRHLCGTLCLPSPNDHPPTSIFQANGERPPAPRVPYLITPVLQVVDVFINCQRFPWVVICGRKAAKTELQRPPEGLLSRLLLLTVPPPSLMAKTLRKILERRQTSALPGMPTGATIRQQRSPSGWAAPQQTSPLQTSPRSLSRYDLGKRAQQLSLPQTCTHMSQRSRGKAGAMLPGASHWGRQVRQRHLLGTRTYGTASSSSSTHRSR